MKFETADKHENADNSGFGNSRADVHFISFWFAIQRQFQAERYLLSFCTYSVLLVLYSADVRAEESLNPLPSAIRGRWALLNRRSNFNFVDLKYLPTFDVTNVRHNYDHFIREC